MSSKKLIDFRISEEGRGSERRGEWVWRKYENFVVRFFRFEELAV
jgi:hypothetical protein